MALILCKSQARAIESLVLAEIGKVFYSGVWFSRRSGDPPGVLSCPANP
jgi:hypothetical protein